MASDTGSLLKRTLSAAIAIVALVASASAAAVAQQVPLVLGKAPNQDVVALPAGSIDTAVAAIPAYVTRILERSGVPGAAVAVVHGGKTIFSQGFGLREVGKAAPIDPATVFQIASVSKSLAATVAAIQVTKGAVSWADPVVKHFPGFRLSDPYVTTHATIGDFYAHRSGLPATAGDELEDIGYRRNEIMARLALVPLDRFRASYHYANLGLTIGATAVAMASREDWETLSERALYSPLGMTSTSSRHRDFLARDNRALLHALVDGRFRPLYDRNPDAQSPAGGVSSNVVDLAKWLKLLLAGGMYDGKQIIAADALLPALSPQAMSSPGQDFDARPGSYGYGFNVGVNSDGRTAMNHSGAFLLGAGTNFQIIPSADIGIVVLTNGGPIGVAEGISFHISDIVQNGAPTRDWFELFNSRMRAFYDPSGDLPGKTQPVNAAPAQPFAAYEGVYDNAYFGAARVAIDGSNLVLSLGPRNDRFVLSHWDGNVFAMTPSGENAPQGSRSSVTFSVKDGKAQTVTIAYLAANGLGTWRR